MMDYRAALLKPSGHAKFEQLAKKHAEVVAELQKVKAEAAAYRAQLVSANSRVDHWKNEAGMRQRANMAMSNTVNNRLLRLHQNFVRDLLGMESSLARVPSINVACMRLVRLAKLTQNCPSILLAEIAPDPEDDDPDEPSEADRDSDWDFEPVAKFVAEVVPGESDAQKLNELAHIIFEEPHK
jgi:hypothetical protein